MTDVARSRSKTARTTSDTPHADDELDAAELELQLEQHRRELTGYCYRMLGSVVRGRGRRAGDDGAGLARATTASRAASALRSWLYRIATNVCLDMLNGRQRRARPMDLGRAGGRGRPRSARRCPRPRGSSRCPTAGWCPTTATRPRWPSPASRSAWRSSAALQHLPPRQRAVLILREVLRWKADEVAELLGHDRRLGQQRPAAGPGHARGQRPSRRPTADPAVDDDQESLLARYVDAFERYDMEALTSLLHEDATQSMPPYDAVAARAATTSFAWCVGPGAACRGLPARADRGQRLAGVRPVQADRPTASYEPWALQVLEIEDGQITGINFFLDTERLFPLFGLPPRLDA